MSTGGQIIVLEDGCVWKVADIDTINSRLWLPTRDIIICVDKLINTDDDESVEAFQIQ